MTARDLASSARRTLHGALRRGGFEVRRVDEPRFMETQGAPVVGQAESSDARLAELRRRYADARHAATSQSRWHRERAAKLDVNRFRGHTMYVWHYVQSPTVTELRYFTYLSYLERRDHAGLLTRVEEDGAFGSPVFTFPGRRPVSRDVLDSVNEILYLDRQLGVLRHDGLRVLDIGAGYGRLAHRMTQLVPGLVDYACTDGVPESTYVCERYLAHRGIQPPCRIIELPDADREIAGGTFDLAVNVHSFPEMPRRAVEHWVGLVAEAAVPALLVVPNEPRALRSMEADGSTLDLLPVLRSAGYELDHVEPIVDDPAARALFGIDDHFHLFRRAELPARSQEPDGA